MTEYKFGYRGNIETLLTVGDTHTDITGFHTIECIYPDHMTITDNFHVVHKYLSKEDAEGKCYDWYVIDKHYRMTDKTEPVKNELTATQEALCDVYESALTQSDSVTNVELALCDIYEQITGGAE